MAAHDESRHNNGPAVPIPESLWIESIWLAGNSVGTVSQLREWQVTIESLTPERRALLDARDDLEQMFMAVANNFLLVEHRKPAQSQEWKRLIESMNDLSAWALRVNMPLMHAHAARISLITLGEYLHDLDAAVAAARVAVEENVDARGRGVIEAAMGKQLSLQNRWSEAREWFARAMLRPASQTPLHLQTLLAAANAEQDFSLPGSITYLRQAIAVADNVDLHTAADRFSARAELAIALFLADELEGAIDLWMEAGSMLVDIEPGDDGARGRIVLFLRLSCNFYLAAAGLVPALQLATPERRVPPPVIGQFEANLAPLEMQLDEFWRTRVQVLLAKIADAQSKRELATRWAGRALESMAGCAEPPSVLREEAQRLADPGTGS
jgi:tetratricopeptide (TPR) repeat protein